jgi:methionyl-tRNA formyltransferase
MKNIKIIFMGTPEFAVPILKSLIENYNIVLVVSQPDKKIGRKQILTSTPIKEIAIKNNIEVFQPEKIRENYQKIIDLNPDIIITCAYGQIIPKEILNCPKLGCINVHASLLPKLRGGAPLHHAIIDGYKETGITIMYMDEQMDTGDIINKKSIEISNTDTVGSIHDKLMILGRDLLLETLPSIIEGNNSRTKQNNEEATYAYNIKREEEHIDFNKTVDEIDRLIRGLNPWPLANIIINDEEIKIIECLPEKIESKDLPGTIVNVSKDSFSIKAKDGIVKVIKIKPFGKSVMLVSDYLNGIKKDNLLNKVCE